MNNIDNKTPRGGGEIGRGRGGEIGRGGGGGGGRGSPDIRRGSPQQHQNYSNGNGNGNIGVAQTQQQSQMTPNTSPSPSPSPLPNQSPNTNLPRTSPLPQKNQLSQQQKQPQGQQQQGQQRPFNQSPNCGRPPQDGSTPPSVPSSSNPSLLLRPSNSPVNPPIRRAAPIRREHNEKINEGNSQIATSEIDQLKLKSMMEKRKHIVKEIFDTETTYMEFLKIIITKFVDPLFNYFKDKNIAQQFYNSIFLSITSIQAIHWEMYKTMSKRIFQYKPEEVWCDIFVNTIHLPQFIEGYQEYINGYDKSANLVNEAKLAITSKGKSTSPKTSMELLGEFIQKQLLTTKFSHLSSYLISPVQRLPRFILFFKDLLKNTPSDHPDHLPITQSLLSLSKIMDEIDKNKGSYDKIYQIENIIRMFSKSDRIEIKAIADISVRDLLICASKEVNAKNKDKPTLVFSWKADLCNSDIDFLLSDDKIPFFRITSQKKITSYPYTIKETHDLYADENSSLTYPQWKSLFEICLKEKTNLFYVFENSSFIAKDMHENLLSEIVSEDLFKDWNLVTYSESEYLKKQNKNSKYLNLILSGQCIIELETGGEKKRVGEFGPGQLLGEITYLSDNPFSDLSTASVIASSDLVKVLRINYGKLNEHLSKDNHLASKFFQLLCVMLATRFIKEKISTSTKKNKRNNNNNSTIRFDDDNNNDNNNNDNNNNKKKNLNINIELLKLNHQIVPRKKQKRLEEISPNMAIKGTFSSPEINSKSKIGKAFAKKNSLGLLDDSSKKKNFRKMSADAVLSSSPSFHCVLKKSRQTLHGDLNLLKNELYFTSKIFGFQYKQSISHSNLQKIDEISPSENQLRVYYKSKNNTLKSIDFIMKNSSDFIKLMQVISSAIQKKQSQSNFSPSSPLPSSEDDLNNSIEDSQKEDNYNNEFSLSSKDWDLLLAISDKLEFPKDKVIIEQGSVPSALYHLSCGSTRVELSRDNSSSVVGKIEVGEMFGELSFLLGNVSSASVISNSDDCVVTALNKSKLELLLFNEPNIAAALYRIIAKNLRDRLVFNQTN